MKSPSLLVGVAASIALGLSLASPAHTAAAPASATPPAAPRRTIPVAEVRPGMIGYGLTVFAGTRPERFPVRVVSVLRRFLPQQDIILIQSDDERLKHSGIVAGMSGSPIYLHDLTADGKPPAPDAPARLAGALAYGWSFAKDPIAGVTPIDNMLAILDRPLRGRDATPFSLAARDAAPAHDATAARAPRPGELVQASIPLSLSGFAPAIVDDLERQFAPFHVVPTASAGGGSPLPSERDDKAAPPRFEPGSAISVQLIRGEMSAAATGTVTWVDGDRVLAFGHPMFNLGEIYLPIATAEVHTFMSSLATSFKIASPLREAGSLLQDRQAAIAADISQKADMIPVEVRVTAGAGPPRTLSAEVVRHRFLTPILAGAVVANAATTLASDVSDATITVRTSLAVRGRAPIELTDHAFAQDGVNARTLAATSGMKAIGDLLFNPFRPANLEKIQVQVQVDYRADVAEITGVHLGADLLDPGSRPSLRVTLRPYNGAEYVESVPFDVPRALAGSVLKIEAAAGNLVKPDLAAPESLNGLIDNLGRAYPARSIVVTVQSPDEALALRGQIVLDLPTTVLDSLRPGASSRRGEVFKESSRVVLPTKNVVVGKAELQVKVRDER